MNQDKVTNAEREYMEQWALAMAQRGSVIRDTRVQERNIRQQNLYLLCPCGSGRKIKFCPH